MPAAQALMELGGLIGNAAYNPEPNSAYGAVQVSPEDYTKHLKAKGVVLPDDYEPPQQALWLTPDGKDVSYAVNNLGLSPNDQFIKPGFFAKMFSSQARDIQARNAASEALPGQSQQLQNIQNTTRANQFNLVRPWAPPSMQNIPAMAGGALTEGNTSPQVLGSVGTSILNNQANVPGTQSATDISTARRMLVASNAAAQRQPTVEASMDAEAASRLSTATGVEPLVIQHQINQLRTQLGQDPTEAQILDNINQIKLGTTRQEKTDLPTTMGTIAGEDAQRNLAANYFPDSLVSSPYLSRVLPGGAIQTSGGQLNPIFRPQAAALMQSLQRGTYMGSGTPTPTSTGNAFIKPNVGSNIIQPTIGTAGNQTSYAPDWLNNANAKMVTLDKYPEITVDTNSGRIYTKDGHDITNDPRVEPIKQAAIQQLQEQEKDKKESAHDAAQATIARKMAILKEQQKHLQAEHKRSGWLPAAAQAYETGSPDNPLGVQMIGKPAEWLGEATSNYHPINKIKSWGNELIGE